MISSFVLIRESMPLQMRLEKYVYKEACRSLNHQRLYPRSLLRSGSRSHTANAKSPALTCVRAVITPAGSVARVWRRASAIVAAVLCCGTRSGLGGSPVRSLKWRCDI